MTGPPAARTAPREACLQNFSLAHLPGHSPKMKKPPEHRSKGLGPSRRRRLLPDRLRHAGGPCAHTTAASRSAPEVKNGRHVVKPRLHAAACQASRPRDGVISLSAPRKPIG